MECQRRATRRFLLPKALGSRNRGHVAPPCGPWPYGVSFFTVIETSRKSVFDPRETELPVQTMLGLQV